MKTAVVAIARNEERYILEWIEHYRTLGFDRITLFDNDDSPKLAGIVDSAGLGEFCHVNGKYIGVRRFVQSDAYKQEYMCIRDRFDWILFVDIDEFLSLDAPLHEFLSDPRYSGFDEIRMNWRIFTDSGRLRWTDEPVTSRFTETLPKSDPLNSQCKSFVRGRIQSFGHISCHGMCGVRACDVHGNKCADCRPSNDGPPIWDTAVIDHYRTKTIEEYLEQKVGRGDTWNKYSNTLETFFRINEKTDEKLDIIEEFKKS